MKTECDSKHWSPEPPRAVPVVSLEPDEKPVIVQDEASNMRELSTFEKFKRLVERYRGA